jgi:hypothetical protein
MARKYKTVRSLLANRKRWIKGNLEHDGAYCIIGAINEVHGPDRLRERAHAKVKRAIDRLFPYFRHTSIMGFNDASVTTHAHILKVVRAAKV